MKIVLVIGRLLATGSLLGLALRPDTRHAGLAVLGIGLTLRLLQPARSAVVTAVGYSIAGIAAACVSASWFPQALRNLGSTESEAGIGFGIAAFACAIPTCFSLGLAVGTTRGCPASTRLATITVAVFTIENVLLRWPSFVPWMLSGYAAIDDPGLAQLASVGGVPLVSAAIMAGGWAISELGAGRGAHTSPRMPTAILGGLIATSVFGLDVAKRSSSPERTSAQKTRLLAIQPALPRTERLRPSLGSLNEKRLLRFSRRARGEDGFEDLLIVWPEGSVLGSGTASQALESARRLTRELDTTLVLGISSATSEARDSNARRGAWNGAASIARDGTRLDSFQKHVGVPIFERRPDSAFARFAADAIGLPGRGARIDESPRLAPLRDPRGVVVALCYEILFSWVVEGRRFREASVIVNLADDSWVERDIATRQLTSIARFRSIEQRLPLVRVAQGGLTASFDAFGQRLDALPLDRFGSIEFEAQTTRRPGWPLRARLLILPIGSSLFLWWIDPTGLLARWIDPSRLRRRSERVSTGDRRASP